MPLKHGSGAWTAAAWLGAAALAGCDGGGASTSSTTTTTTPGTGGGGTTMIGGSAGTGGAGGGTSPAGGSGGTAGTGGATTTSTGTGGDGPECSAFAHRWGGSSGADEARLSGVVVSGGGAIVAGEITGAAQVGGQILTSGGGADVLVARLKPGGTLDWAKRFGSIYDDRVKAIAATEAGGAVVVGTFDGVVDFGGTTLTSIAGPDAFVMRVDASGQTSFVLQIENADARAVAVEESGDILVAGDFTGTTTFGQIPLTSSANDVFVARLGPDGSVLAAQRYAYEVKAGALALAAGGGRVYLTGSFQNSVDFGAGPITSAGSRDVLVARLDGALAPVFVKRFGDSTSQEARAVAVLPDGGAAIAGAFRGKMDLGVSVLTADTLDDAFVVRLTEDGDVLFGLRFGDPATQGARSIAAGAGGELLLAGGFEGTLDAGDGPITSAGGEDVFLLRLDAAGVPLKSMRWGGGGDQRARAVAVDPCGAVLIGGDFTGSLPWDGDVLDATGGTDLFIARLAP